VIINIRIADPDNKRARNSLHNWLNGNQYVRENAQLKLPDSAPDGMGAEFDVIQLVLSSGFDLGNLALAFAEWRDKSRETAAPIAVQANGRTTELSLDDMAGSGDEAYIVRRALAGAPDPRQSSCVVIGISDYGRLRALPAVRENLVQLPRVLADPGIWGIPPGRLHVIAYPQSGDAIRNAICAAARDAPDTLLVYFAGHGVYDRKDGLLLALPEATGKDRSQTVPWRELAEVIRNAGSHRRIVWLDCCYAGLALPDKEAAAGKQDPPDLLEVAEVEGTYLLAATQKHEEARSGDGDGDGGTAFTRELVSALRDGIAPGPPEREFLSLNSLHQQVRSALRDKHLPQPSRHDPDNIGQLPHFRNNMTHRRGSRVARPIAGGTWRLPRFPSRYVMGAGLGVLIVLAAVLLATRPRPPRPAPAPPPTISSAPAPAVLAPPLGGVSETEYCSNMSVQGESSFVPATEDCIQKINLDAACSWQYNVPGLEYKLTSPDSDSAICDSPATGTPYNDGIPNMRKYCETLTANPVVYATTHNRDYRKTWVCQAPINWNVACVEQYYRSSVVARHEGGGWYCYEG
jgi:Effector Associated Constant Component 1/Caspase domain